MLRCLDEKRNTTFRRVFLATGPNGALCASPRAAEWKLPSQMEPAVTQLLEERRQIVDALEEHHAAMRMFAPWL